MTQRTVLIADDEPDIVETIRFRLEQDGYEVVTAQDGVEALRQARDIEPDLVILDVMMPKENGYRVAREIRQDYGWGKSSKRIPIILLTARNLSADPGREKMFADFSQADRIMYKPFEMEELVVEVRRLLKA